ncbi:MAG: choice-of-anchor I family protein [Verrucomicrobia bacterium]|nr:choice-of-anchor I family protein [Verrucomicrobiota bacterium]
MQPALDVNQLGTYATGIDGESAAEIISYDPLAQRAFISNAFQNGIDVVDIRNPNNPKVIMEIKNLGGNVNSVSVKNGIVAVAVENENPQMNGSVVFLDVLTGSILNRLPVGPMPDMVTFSPDGTMVVTANEGEPNDDYTIDPKGSISIIYLGSGSIVETVLADESDVTTVGFEAYDFLVDFFLEAGIRIFGEIRNPRTGEFLRYSRPSEDFEPEFVAISEDSRTAYITMQENNAIAVIDLVQGQLIDLIPLGFKDHSVPGSGLDASDVDGGINIRPWPVKGMYLPDAIATYETLGKTFLVIANEGDSRDYDGFGEEARVRDLNLDPTAFPNAEELQMPGNLGRLKTTTTMGDLDGDGDYDEIYTFGARSFSILDEHGNIIWDSGDQFERIIADLDPFQFNISPFDGRSDDKGPEPEGLALGTINGRKYAFIGLERQSAVMVYDITYPYEPTFVQYIKNRSGDVSPEGLVFVDSELSPTGEPMLLVANEVSGSTTFNNIHINPVREFKMQILHSSDNESSFQDPNTLEPKILHYGAIVDGLQALAAREGIPSIHVTAGDHTLPSQFYQASEEAFGARGLGDIMFFNAMGLVANGIGNHEFDGGINDFARMLNIAQYPFIAANLDFSQVQLESETPAIRRGIDGGSVEENAGKVVKSAYVMAGGEKIGLIGRAPADFFNVIADPDTTIPGLDFVGGRNPDNNQPLVSALTQVLEQVALLEAQGINKIILLDHAQDFTGDPLSASNLSGIDIIVAAGSTGFMAKSEPNGPFNLLRPGNSPSADYPTVREDADGNTVLVVNSDQLFSYVGNLIVGFDHMGHINHIDDRSGPIATTQEGVMALDQLLPGYDVQASDEVQNIYSQLIETPLILDLFDVIGITSGALNGNRADVRSRETNLGRLAADSTLWFAQEWVKSEGLPMEVDVALKNGGGIRNSIVGPVITKLAVATALAFDNKLAIMKLSGAELIAAMENAVSRNPSLDGRFPQIAGMDLEFVPALPGVSDQITLSVPSRIRRLVIHRANGTDDVLIDNFMAQGDLTRQFTLATNDFLSTGGDGYRVFQAVSEDPTRGALRPPVGERQILSEYIELALNGEVDIPVRCPLPGSALSRASSSFIMRV